MQQYSSLPEQNSQVDAMPILATVQQLRAELWMERSLNKLQSSLNDCLSSALTTNEHQLASDGYSKFFLVAEAEIFQTVVKELNIALNGSKVAIALLQPDETIRICYLCSSSRPQDREEAIVKTGKKLRLKLKQVIDIEDLQHLENQQPPCAWQIASSNSRVIGWLVMATAPLGFSCESLKASQDVTSQLMLNAAKQCAYAIQQLRQIQSFQQRTQHLESFNQELERTNQLKNQFLANTSHEIRTPLSSIIGFTHLLLAQGYNPGKQRHQEYLNIILSSSKHLLALINDILDLSKIEANQLEVQWETVNVPELCHNVLALVKEKAANKNLKLRREINPDVTTLVADSLRLKQMLLNLLFNALKFTITGSVGLQVAKKNTFVHFTVWDTGAGISKQDQEQLFQPYFQIANAITSPEEGTGLGLAVTRKLAEIHGGWVEVESELARGSRFTIVLPLHPVEAKTESACSQEQITFCFPQVKTQDCLAKILLVEDDLPNAQLMQTYLGQLGYQVTWVKNIAQIREALRTLHPAVILMDIHLPDGNALKVVQQLRENQQYQNIPIIAQTAMAMKGDREICLAAGVNDYISKPIDLEILATLVSKYTQVESRE